MWDLWWTKWHWDRITLSASVPLTILIPPNAPYPSIIRDWYNKPISGRRTKWTVLTPPHEEKNCSTRFHSSRQNYNCPRANVMKLSMRSESTGLFKSTVPEFAWTEWATHQKLTSTGSNQVSFKLVFYINLSWILHCWTKPDQLPLMISKPQETYWHFVKSGSVNLQQPIKSTAAVFIILELFTQSRYLATFLIFSVPFYSLFTISYRKIRLTTFW
jgi:hypothetical protein